MRILPIYIPAAITNEYNTKVDAIELLPGDNKSVIQSINGLILIQYSYSQFDILHFLNCKVTHIFHYTQTEMQGLMKYGYELVSLQGDLGVFDTKIGKLAKDW
jgi:hypothetical protein